MLMRAGAGCSGGRQGAGTTRAGADEEASVGVDAREVSIWWGERGRRAQAEVRGRRGGWGSPLLVLQGGLAALQRAGVSYPGVKRRAQGGGGGDGKGG